MTVLRVQLAIVGAALALAGGAWAAYPGTGTSLSAFARDGTRYEADVQHGRTNLQVLRGGKRARSTTLRGNYGFPMPTNQASGEGVSHDGKTLVLARIGSFGRFAVLDARTLRLRRTIALHGQFSYDALSPNASTLYLIQHVSPPDRYYVRAYDLRAGRLLKQIVFDTREKGEVMRGVPVARATGPTGRWVYTLYGHANGTLFVHALDSVDRHAFCVDLPARVSSEAMSGLRLRLTGSTLAVLRAGARIGAIDTKTLHVTKR